MAHLDSSSTVIQKTSASHIHRRLREQGLRVLLTFQGEDKLTSEDERHILEAPVHLPMAHLDSSSTVIQKPYASHIHRRLREQGLRVLLKFEGEDELTSESFPCPYINAHDVFINSDDTVIQKTLASHIHRRLREHGLRVAFNFEGEDKLTSENERHIREASVHLAVFSPGYAGSSWCLNELMFRLESMKDPESDSTIVPVFYGVKPSQLRWTERDDGVYAESLRSFQKKKTFDSNTIEQWREALSEVAGKSGFELDAFNGDKGKLVDQIVKRVLKKLQNHLYYDVFINHRGPDVKKSFASHLYHRLVAHGLRVFLDTEELEKGDTIPSQLEGAIRTASIHVAIFSPRYAESSWCLMELEWMTASMRESGSTIIPVFYHVDPSDVRWTKGVYANAMHHWKNSERYDSVTIDKWRKALSDAAVISGFRIEACNGDEGQLVHQVVRKVLTLIAQRYPTGL